MSEPYIVSARKYRPQTFDSVVGQQHITDTLKNAIRNSHLAHAYLFCGPRGVGKTTCARILARTINCEQPTARVEACGKCSTCKSFEENTSLNIFELDAASNNSVDDIRRLNEQVRYAPQHGKYKIYIIDEVHMLSSAAFNAFLKTLEEPPPYAIFILATTEKHKILPTILSRCQIFDFRRIQTEDIVIHLSGICQKESQQAEEAALHIIAQKSEGCMRDALSMMDRIAGFSEGKLSYMKVIEHLNILDASVYFKFVEQLLVKDLSGALLYLDEIFQKGFEGDHILSGFSEHFRNLLLSRDITLAKLIDLPAELKQKYFQHARVAGQSYLISALSVLNDAELKYKAALNKRLHVEMTLIRLCYLNDWLEVDTVSPELGLNEKKKLNSGPETIVDAAKKSMAETGAQGASSVSSTKQVSGNSLKTAETAPSGTTISTVSSHSAVRSEDPVTSTSSSPSISSTATSVPALSDREVRNVSKSRINADPKPTGKNRLSKNMLSEIRAVQKTGDKPEQIKLTPGLAAKYLTDYLPLLRTRNIPAAEQLKMLELKCVHEETIELICNTGIQYTYASAVKEDFADYCRSQTHNAHLKVLVTQSESVEPQVPQDTLILSKLEIYERMSEKNPALKQLKDRLGLSVEF